eukprot:SAG11_NODE_19288_length_470_cov_0.695418_2_plen_20_part_01
MMVQNQSTHRLMILAATWFA